VKYFTKVVARRMQMLDFQSQDKKEPDISEIEEDVSEEE
jgi:hypothetical protein